MSREFFIVAAALLGLAGPLLVLTLVRLQRRPRRRVADGEPQAAAVDAAFRDTGAGVAFFDAYERLVLATPRYAELLGLTADDLAPAMPLSVLLQGAAFRGDAADAVGREAVWVEEALHAHRRGAGPSLQRGRNNRWLCLAIGATPTGGRVHVLTDVSALGQARRQIGEAVRRLARQGAFDPVNALIGMPDPVRPVLGEVTVELHRQVEGLSSALARLEPGNDNETSVAGVRDAVGGLSRLAERYASVEKAAQPA